jgi:hypothetical protein
MLTRDAGNQHDPNAVKVWLATERDGGRFRKLQEAGFIPRRLCLHCGKSFGGKSADDDECPYCHKDLSRNPMSRLNAYLCQNYFDVDMGVYYAVHWINRVSPESSWGCQLALGLPPGELRPPE